MRMKQQRDRLSRGCRRESASAREGRVIPTCQRSGNPSKLSPRLVIIIDQGGFKARIVIVKQQGPRWTRGSTDLLDPSPDRTDERSLHEAHHKWSAQTEGSQPRATEWRLTQYRRRSPSGVKELQRA